MRHVDTRWDKISCRLWHACRIFNRKYKGNKLRTCAIILAILTVLTLGALRLMPGFDTQPAWHVFIWFPGVILGYGFILLLLYLLGRWEGSRYEREKESLHWVWPYDYWKDNPQIDREKFKQAWMNVPVPLERKRLLMQSTTIAPADAPSCKISDEDLSILAALCGTYQEIWYTDYEEVWE